MKLDPKIGRSLKKASPTILTCIGAAGVVATAVLAVKATPKADSLIKADSRRNHDGDPYAATKLEAVKSCWKCYIPAAATGVATIICIFGANTLNKKQQASLASAYALVNRSYSDYKHKEFDKARKMLNGALAKYLTDESAADALAQALKIAINSVYGLTSASFENPFHDNRNKDNIVAKRGALFMINLKHEVQKRGFVVAHIKTDSIKIPDATPEIIQFVMDYGKMYGYIFEHEATYDRMCLVNNAVYIAKYKDGKHAGEWTATGTQFQIPYVFKKLFSHEEITFEDMCETKSVTGALYLDMNESLPDVSALEDEYAKLWKKISDTTKLNEPMEAECARIEELTTEIEKGHDYVFIGRVGQFCPIKPGCGGGLLCRESVDKKTGEKKYDAAVGTKGYRWLESEMVKELGKEDCIDRRYYDALVDAAATDISKYGDFEWFVSEDPYVSDTPPWFSPGEPHEEDSIPFDVR